MVDIMGKKSVPEPWERLKGESQKAYDLFLEYVKLGPNRSLEKVSKKVEKSQAYMEKLSQAYGWVQRAKAFDADQNRQFFVELRQQVKESAATVARLGHVIQNKAIEGLAHYDIDTGNDPKRIRLSDVPKWAEAGVRIVQLAMQMGPEEEALHDPEPSINEVMPILLEVLEQYPDVMEAVRKRLEEEPD